MKIVAFITAFLVSSMMGIGLIFKYFRWPGSGEMILVGTLLFCTIYLLIVGIYVYKERSRGLSLGMLFLFMPFLLAVTGPIMEGAKSYDFSDNFMVMGKKMSITKAKLLKANELLYQILEEKEENENHRIELTERSEKIKLLTKDVSSYLDTLKEELRLNAGGVTEDGNLVDENNIFKQKYFMLGVDGKKDGKAYDLQNKIHNYISELNVIVPLVKLESFTIDGNESFTFFIEKEVPYFKNNPRFNKKDFAHLNFEGMSNIGALAILVQMQVELLTIEQEAILELMKEVE